MWKRIRALTLKEFIQFTRDRRTLLAVLLGPALELILFAAAIHTDVRHISMVVADQSMTATSRAYLESFTVSGSFDIVLVVSSQVDVVNAIDRGQASLGVVVPPDFAEQLSKGAASVLMLVDGSTSFTSQTALNTATAISQQYAAGVMTATTTGQTGGLNAHVQILYNPDLKDLWFITPAFVAFLLQALTMNLTSLAVVREREAGTIEALLVTPIRPFELMVAKTVPSLIAAVGSALSMLVISILILGVPFRGNVLLFAALALLSVGCGLGLGLAISSVVQTQNQSQQLASLVNLTGMFLGGVLFPVYTLPFILRALSAVFPSSYFIPVLRGMFLKGIGFSDLWQQALALIVLLVLILGAATRLFRQRLD